MAPDRRTVWEAFGMLARGLDISSDYVGALRTGVVPSDMTAFSRYGSRGIGILEMLRRLSPDEQVRKAAVDELRDLNLCPGQKPIPAYRGRPGAYA